MVLGYQHRRYSDTNSRDQFFNSVQFINKQWHFCEESKEIPHIHWVLNEIFQADWTVVCQGKAKDLCTIGMLVREYFEQKSTLQGHGCDGDHSPESWESQDFHNKLMSGIPIYIFRKPPFNCCLYFGTSRQLCIILDSRTNVG